jgi:hypothetical protein
MCTLVIPVVNLCFDVEYVENQREVDDREMADNLRDLENTSPGFWQSWSSWVDVVTRELATLSPPLPPPSPPPPPPPSSQPPTPRSEGRTYMCILCLEVVGQAQILFTACCISHLCLTCFDSLMASLPRGRNWRCFYCRTILVAGTVDVVSSFIESFIRPQVIRRRRQQRRRAEMRDAPYRFQYIRESGPRRRSPRLTEIHLPSQPQ